jgi:Zn-dependent metalloprotease
MRKTLSFSKGISLLLLFCIAGGAYAQRTPQQIQEQKQNILKDPNITQVRFDEERQTPAFISLKSSRQTYSKAQAQFALTNILNVRQGIDGLVPAREVKLANNMSVVEFHQYYKGIKVEHARYTALAKGDQILVFNGAWYDVPASLATSAKISKGAALERAKGSTNARKYAWEQVQELIAKEKNATMKAALQKELQDIAPEGELVVVKDYTKNGVAQMRLAYKYNIYAVEPLSRAWVYVDAEDGRILFRDKIIKHVNDNPNSTSVTTTVQTRYAGLRTIKTKQISGNDPNTGLPITSSNPTELYVPGAATYGLIDDSRGKGIETYDLNGVGGLPISLAPAYAQGKSFTDVNNNWTAAEHKRGAAAESENDDIAWDAHWGAEVVYDYWKQKQNRLSFDGADAKIKSFIHSGVGYDNAFWNGSVMTYGDGSFPAPGGFRPLTSLDVCAHEIGHGVCTFTADLVYAKESGAMNEGYSDVWAACAEYYAIKSVDPSLAAVYKPFYIGEQISEDPASPLRRMDNPKAAGDPDTYGGDNWENPDCSPSLANDQCGVHTNSGVLNKWFYLLTVGSGGGSGPDAAFAGEDDGVNDLGNKYTVQGLGFDVAEKIAYLTELMLTSTATFAEARAVSIQVAASLSGNPCSSLVKSVTDAWYAVGVGAAFVQPCSITYGFIFQPGSFTSEAQSGAGCNAETAVNVPVLLPPGATATFAIAGTATNGTDYRLSATSLSNNTANSKQETLVVYVKNDAVVESDETVVLKAAITNAGTNPVNSQYTLTIVEDDVVPVISTGVKTLLSETFTRADGFADPTGWTEILEVPEDPNGAQAAQGKNQWGIFGNKLAITGRDEITGTQLPNMIYNNNSTSQTIIKSPLIDARGLNTLNLKFDFEVQGEVEPNGTNSAAWPALDYMAIVYSFDGTTWFELAQPPFVRFAAAAPTNGAATGTLPSFLNNKQFYLGFRWVNDPLIGGPVSVSVDNLSLQASARTIENDINHSSRENLNAGQQVYFYSIQDGQILGSVKNESTKDFGCTNTFVEKAGTGTFNLYQGTKDGLHKVADKVVRVEAALIYKAQTKVSLYFTNDQLTALEQATGKQRTQFSVYHVNAAGYTGASSQNTKQYTAIYTPITGVGAYYTITNPEKVNGSYALGTAVSVPGTLTQMESASKLPEQAVANSWKFSGVYPNPGSGVATVNVTSPTATRMTIDIVNVSGQVLSTRTEQVVEGLRTINLPVDRLSRGAYLIRFRDAEGNLLNTQHYTRN